ncbi:Hsp20/alpha crystallin family protein [Natroniella sulfidigena]|uniref:Hsp20/alpha crystallin family protein n=1 Tax=Natroniella sulfidigena TaxID=723921 RepID=UPI00200B9871|nr:Hsp20/alpha crystallin family protein [Natroniella sulfidigena]MCK8816693.1 Hsp20/alpha crystallin family protein [Natroniella sulfidigena]
MHHTQNQSQFLGQGQAFVGQNLQSGMMGYNQGFTSNAWNYRLQPVATAMNTAQQTGGQFQQNNNLSGSGSYMQGGQQSIFQPSIDISETQNDLVVACSMQNANPNNIDLTATEDSVSISAQSFIGNQTSSLHRTIPLPTTIRAEAIDASYSNGVLRIRMPKRETSARKQLQVNVNE